MLARFQQYINPYVPSTIKSFYQTVISKTYSIYQSVSQHSYTQAIFALAKKINTTHSVQNFKEGLLQPYVNLPKAIVAIEVSDKVKRVVKQSAYTGGTLFLVSYVYYGWLRPMFTLLAPENSYQQAIMDVAITTYLIDKLPRFYIDDMVNTISLSSVIAEVTPEKNKEYFECKCDPIEKARGNFNTNFHYISHVATLFMLSNNRYLGKVVELTLGSWLLGQTLFDYRLNMCDKHRYEVVSKNNSYFYGVGTAINSSALLLRWWLGVDSFFIMLVLQSMIMKLAMITSATHDHPLPGGGIELDFFYYVRDVGMRIIQDASNKLNLILKQRKKDKSKATSEQDFSKEFYALVQNYLSTTVAVVVGEEYAKLDTLVKTPALSLLIRLKEDEIRLGLDSIAKAQEHPLVIGIAKAIIKRIPKIFFPTTVGKKELLFFINVIYLNAVKEALPKVRELFNLAVSDVPIQHFFNEAKLESNHITVDVKEEKDSTLSVDISNANKNLLKEMVSKELEASLLTNMNSQPEESENIPNGKLNGKLPSLSPLLQNNYFPSTVSPRLESQSPKEKKRVFR